MPFDFTIKQQALDPPLWVAPKNADRQGMIFAGTPLVTFSMWRRFTDQPVIDHAAAVLGVGTDGFATLTYAWQSGDTLLPGDFAGRFDVIPASGRPQSFPTPGDIAILIDPLQS